MRKLLFLSVLAAAFFMASCSSQAPMLTSSIPSSQVTQAGVFYSLPRNVIAIDVVVEEIQHQPGPYATFAERMLGLENVIQTHEVEYHLSGMEIRAFTEPDPDHLYQLILPPGMEGESSVFVTLGETGVIYGLNRQAEHRAYLPEQLHHPGHRTGSGTSFNYFIDTNLEQRIDTIIEHVRIDTTTVQRQTLRSSWVEKSTEIKAQEVADHILLLREKKFDLITGFQEITYSKEAIEYMVSQMERMENDYLALFTGMSTTSEIHYRFIHTPRKEEAGKPLTLFRFSGRDGLTEADASRGTPVTITFERSSTTDLLQRQMQGQHPSDKGGSEAPAAGIHYRIPEFGHIAIHMGGELRADARMPINQFGIVTTLPAQQLEVEFHPNTGSIRSVSTKPPKEEEKK